MAGGGGQQGASAPTQNGPNVYGGETNPAGGGPYGGFNAQGQDAVNTAQANYTQSGGQGQLTQAQQAAIAYNANPQGQPVPQGMSDIAYAQGAMGSLGQAANIYGGGINPQAAQFQTNRMQPVPIPQLQGQQDPMSAGAMQYNPQGQVPLAPYQGSQTPAAPTNYISSNAAPPGPPPDIMQYGAPPPPQGMPPQGMPPQFQPQARQPLQIKKNMNIAAPQRHNIQVLGNPTATQYAPRGRRGVR